MSQPSVIYWPPCVGNEASIAALQDVAIGGNVILNPGHPETPGTFAYNKIIRSILFDSPDDLSGVTFVISGIGSPLNDPLIGDGNPKQILQPITENVAGAAVMPVFSEKIFSQITSIVVTGAPATNLTVGFGRFGITDYVFYGYNRIATSLSVATLQFINNNTMTAGVYFSVNKPETPDISQGGILVPHGTENGEYLTFIPAFNLIPTTENKNAIQIVSGPITVIWATVLDTSLAQPDSLYFTFLQQGVSS